MEGQMTRKYFAQQFPDIRDDKMKRRKRFTKHYEVKMRLKKMWYKPHKPHTSH